MHRPHFETRPLSASASFGALLVRTAECLTALVQAPTAQSGLNESRYNVLDALRRRDSGPCSQAELATHLLQSESNLSTLLDRMRKDGLISRERSVSDRRIALIALAAAGREALDRADQARARATAPVLQVLDEEREAALGEGLQLLLRRLELALGLAGGARPPADAADATGPLAARLQESNDVRGGESRPPANL